MIGYYVTVKRGGKTGWLFGPILDHELCKAFVPAVRKLAYEIDPRTHFDAFGTSSITRDDDAPLPPGKLNDQWVHYPLDHHNDQR